MKPRLSNLKFATALRNRPAFSMIETTISIIIVSILLIGSLETLSFAVRSTSRNQEGLLANCFAEQIYSEISILNFIDPNETTESLGCELSEAHAASRIHFDDIDDYHGLTESTLTFRDGATIPDSFGWTRSVKIESISPEDLNTAVPTSGHLRKITVTLTRTQGGSYTFQYLMSRDGFRSPSTMPGNARAAWETEWELSGTAHNWATPLRNHPDTTTYGF